MIKLYKILLSALIIAGCSSTPKPVLTLRNQQLTVDTLKIIYAGVPNRLSVSGPINDSLTVSTTFSDKPITFFPNKDFFTLNYGRNTVGKHDTLIFKRGKEIMLKEVYEVRFPSDPKPFFAGNTDSVISKKQIISNPCLGIYLPDCYLNIKFYVESFQPILYIDKQPIEMPVQNGACFEDSTMINKLNPGDKILFRNIQMMCPDGVVRTWFPLIISVK